MNKYLMTSLLIIGLASPALAADHKTAQTHLAYVGNGHPDPCWSLQLQRHRNAQAWSRFESCIARHNYNN